MKADSLKSELRRISDILGVPSPRTYSILDNHKNMETRITRLIVDVKEYEQGILNRDLIGLKDLIRALKAAISEYRAKSAQGLTTYTAGDIASSDKFISLYEERQKSIGYRNQYAGALDAAIANEMKVQDAIREELAKLRMKEAQGQMLQSSLIMVTGAVAIIASAGAATPIVIAACATGGCTMAYGLSNYIEATESYFLGLDGNIEISAFNPIRDTLFCGNQMAYDITGSILTTTSCWGST